MGRSREEIMAALPETRRARIEARAVLSPVSGAKVV